ncbi:hypothetical protein KUBF_29380 [Bacteroides finegoldii]|nr:hypothetical protein KUBF_29380 [Bacteroides finegoldii]
MGNNGQWIEVQIRSERMNDVAEQGFAAHWKYKEGGGSEDEGELEKWLKTIKEILDDPQPDAIDFLDTIKLNLFASEYLCSHPKGTKDYATEFNGTRLRILPAYRHR